jgi:hypothetical protein
MSNRYEVATIMEMDIEEVRWFPTPNKCPHTISVICDGTLHNFISKTKPQKR